MYFLDDEFYIYLHVPILCTNEYLVRSSTNEDDKDSEDTDFNLIDEVVFLQLSFGFAVSGDIGRAHLTPSSYVSDFTHTYT